MGNLTVAFGCKDQLDIKFYDEFSEYYFVPKNFKIKGVKDKMISLYPFPSAENITTKGLNWSLVNGNLSITSRIGTRNFAVEDEVSIEYEKGDLLILLEKTICEFKHKLHKCFHKSHNLIFVMRMKSAKNICNINRNGL